MGMVNYLSAYAPQLATVASPLTKQCGSTQEWHWHYLEEESFKQVKNIISAEAMLTPLNYGSDQPIFLITDASAKGIGAWIGQGPTPYDIRLAAFYSRKFYDSELNYSVTDKEVLAIINPLEHFEPQLTGTKFTILTDHMAATTFPKYKDIGDRQIRQKTKLSRFDCDIQYLEGGKNILADALSRFYKDSDSLPPIIKNPHPTFIHPQQPPPPKIPKSSQQPSNTLLHPSIPSLKNSTKKSTTNSDMKLTYAQVTSAAVSTRSQKAPQTETVPVDQTKPLWDSDSTQTDRSHMDCACNPCRGRANQAGHHKDCPFQEIEQQYQD